MGEEMKTIGITGGIGSGKSTVSDYLEKKGYFVIDADKMSREMTKTGGSCLENLREAFGDGIFFEDGSLDRKKLGRIVFSDFSKKALLEELTTKVIVKNIKEEIKRLREGGWQETIFVDAPLLFETGMDALTDFVWLITADEGLRVKRAASLYGISPEQVRLRIKSQTSDTEKAGRSTEIIDNSKGKEELYRKIDQLLAKYV